MAPIEEKSEGAPEAPEDPPIVKALKEVDDRYLALEKEYEKEVQELTRKYTEMQRPFLEHRKDILVKCDGPATTGTPALKGFWMQAMKKHPAFEDSIQEWDEPVLEYLVDIVKSDLDEEDSDKGFKITFMFMENPYFTNTELTKEWHTVETNPYAGEIDCTKITSSKVEWKAGKDVTVEKVQKKVKGGGAKKAKQKKEKEEPRASFFRELFRNLEQGMSLTDDLREEVMGMMEDDEEDDMDDNEEMIEMLMERDHEVGTALRDQIIPWAVRWYTGEAAPEVEADDDDEDDEEEDEDDTDEDESEEDAPKGKGKGKGKAKAKAKAGASSPETKPSEQPKEECKQQ